MINISEQYFIMHDVKLAPACNVETCYYFFQIRKRNTRLNVGLNVSTGSKQFNIRLEALR